MSTSPSEVSSLIVPMETGYLLVPNSCVAEIVPYATTEKEDGSPPWVVGDLNWRDVRVPCISFEQLIGKVEGETGKIERIAVFNTLSPTSRLRYWGIAITGIPRLVRVVESEIVEDDVDLSAFEKLQVQWGGETCTIPDLSAIEKLLMTAALG